MYLPRYFNHLKIIVQVEESVKKEMNNCDCCGEDLATAHTV